jgi:enamine deaminase RidA (YjgF/YER057c/UK114 family)
MWRLAVACLLALCASPAGSAEYMEKTPFQMSRAFSPGVITDGGKMVWVSGQTALRDKDDKDIAGNFEAQVRQVFYQIDAIMKRAGGSVADIVSVTVFIKEPRYGDRFVEIRKEYFKDGNYPGSALITVSNFARPGIEIEIQAVGDWRSLLQRKSMLGRSDCKKEMSEQDLTPASPRSGARCGRRPWS